MTRLLLYFSLIVVAMFAGNFSTIAQAAQNTDGVRNSTDRIMTSPEFRHLRRLLGSKSSSNGFPQGSSGSGSGTGTGSKSSGSGSGSPNGTEGGDGTGNGTGTDGKPSGSSDGKGNNANGSTDGTGNDNPNGSSKEPGNNNTNDSSDAGSSSPPPPQRSSSSADESSSSALGSGIAGGLGAIAQIFFWIIIAVVAGAMIYFVVMAFLDRESSNPTEEAELTQQAVVEEEPEQAPGEIPADVYITRARELAAQGLYNDAIAQLLLGAMSNIERAGLIQYRRGLTNRDYLRVIRPNKGPHSAFRLIVRTYEPIGFGRRNANQTHFEKSLSGYEQGFRSTLESA